MFAAGRTTGYSSFAVCHRHSAKTKKHSAKALPSVTLGKPHTALFCRQTAICRVFFIAHSANGLPSVKFDTRQKKVVCRVFFQNTLGKGLLFAECFWNYTRQTYFPKKKKISQHTVTVCRVFFEITLGKPIFQRKKNICRS